MPVLTYPSLNHDELSNLCLSDSASGYRAIQVSGADAAEFLHGQLTANITRLSAGEGIPAALCTVQGRVTSTLDVLRDTSDLWLIVPASLVEVVVTQLRKYVLRAKVVFSDQAMPVSMTFDPTATSGRVTSTESAVLYAPTWATVSASQGVMSFSKPAHDCAAAVNDPSDWSALRVLLGVCATDDRSSNQHLPQMLNLDLLGAVDFHKGCYTGQEIIARTHFRGTVKRRMLRFIVRAEVATDSGTELVDANGKKAGDIVTAAADSAGNIGILAVVRLEQQNAALFINHQPAELWDLPYSITE